MIRLKRLTVLASTLLFFYGCAAAALIGVGAGVGVATYKFVDGRLVRDYPLAYGRAWDATNRAMENLRISISNSMDKGTKGTIDAVRKDGIKVSISLKDKGQGVTSISVRVGTFGDRLQAQKVHEEIASVSGI